MPNKHFGARHLLWRPRRAKMTTSALPVDLPPPPPPPPAAAASLYSSPANHGLLCLALADRLIRRGLLSIGRDVFCRIVANRPSSVHEAISAVDCARSGGTDLDPAGFGTLVRKLVGCGQHGLAKLLFRDRVARCRIEVDLSALNYMITCYCRLGKIEEAVDLYNRIVDLGSFPTRLACYAIERELCAWVPVSQAFGVFIAMSDDGMDMGIWIYNLLADKLCKKRCLDETYEVLSLMRERSRLMPMLSTRTRPCFVNFVGKDRLKRQSFYLGRWNPSSFLSIR